MGFAEARARPIDVKTFSLVLTIYTGISCITLQYCRRQSIRRCLATTTRNTGRLLPRDISPYGKINLRMRNRNLGGWGASCMGGC